jgi:hypothetical protein
MTSNTLSEYEALREKNMVANEKYLISLGLNSIADEINGFSSNLKSSSKRKAELPLCRKWNRLPARKKSSRIELKVVEQSSSTTTSLKTDKIMEKTLLLDDYRRFTVSFDVLRSIVDEKISNERISVNVCIIWLKNVIDFMRTFLYNL